MLGCSGAVWTDEDALLNISKDNAMNSCNDLDSMSIDKLWALHELVIAELVRRINAERTALDMRLRQLGAAPQKQSRPEKRLSPAAPTRHPNPKNYKGT